MEVFIEPVEASPDVYIFGAGHVGYFVAKMAHEVGFRVHVIDDREKFANAERFGEGIDVSRRPHPDLAGHAHAAADGLCRHRDARPHARPRRAARPGRSAVRYVGLIGSRAKVKRIYDALRRGRA